MADNVSVESTLETPFKNTSSIEAVTIALCFIGDANSWNDLMASYFPCFLYVLQGSYSLYPCGEPPHYCRD